MKTKKTLLALTLMSGFAGIAHAQSSVTLYGVLDEGLNFLNSAPNTTAGQHPGPKYTLDSLDGVNGSRWGLKGAEDLGGGLLAVFTLESGINLNTGGAGQGGLEFGRQAFVGLSDSRYGTVTAGRQYDMVVKYLQPVSAPGYWGGNAFEHPGDMANLSNSYRTNNTIVYASPSYNGLTFGAEVSVGGQAGNVSAIGGYSAGAAYANGPLTLGAGYMYFKDPDGSTAPNTGGAASSGYFNSNGTTSTFGSLNSAYQTATAYQVAGAGGTYAIGPVLIGLTYANIQYGNLQSTNLVGKSATFNDLEVGLKYIMSPAISLGAAYDYTKGNNITGSTGINVGNQHYNQFSVMADYALSKRTDVYVQAAYQRAAGTNSQGKAAVADIASFGDSDSNTQVQARVALRVKF